MELIVTNLEDVPDDLPPGRYCCRLESMTWQEMKVRFVPGSQHQPGDCLIQLTKEEPAAPEDDADLFGEAWMAEAESGSASTGAWVESAGEAYATAEAEGLAAADLDEGA